MSIAGALPDRAEPGDDLEGACVSTAVPGQFAFGAALEPGAFVAAEELEE